MLVILLVLCLAFSSMHQRFVLSPQIYSVFMIIARNLLLFLGKKRLPKVMNAKKNEIRRQNND